MRIAAFPEHSNLPREVPLDDFLTVTVAYEPFDLKFNIMSQDSQTGSLSPPPVVKSKALPYEALQYQSKITHIGQISTILSKHGLEISPDLAVRVFVLMREAVMPLRDQISSNMLLGAKST